MAVSAMDLISVVLCTYNRSRSLRQTLECLAAQQADGFDYEVVVVDNNSADDTKAVVEHCQPSFNGRLRYVFEGRQGQSYARNAGLAASRGRFIAFTDDDVRPEPAWLQALLGAFRAFGADCVYGKVLPLWLAPQPAWLGPYFQRRLAMLNQGDAAFLATSPQEPLVGANFAVRRDVLETVGRFDVALGNRGERIGGEEDTDLFERLLTHGARIAYAPQAVVRHVVGPERMTPAYFRRWHFDHGVAAARVTTCTPGRALLGIPFWAIRKFVRELTGYLQSACGTDPERRLAQRMKLVYYAGLFLERIKIAMGRPREASCPRS